MVFPFIALLLIVIFSVSQVHGDHVVTTLAGETNFTVIENQTTLFNITINNTDPLSTANISEVNITLPSSLEYIQNTAAASVSALVGNTSNRIQYTTLPGLMNLSTGQFWFNATGTPDGIYNITVTTTNASGSFDSNISVTILFPYLTVNFTTPVSGDIIVNQNFSTVNVSFTGANVTVEIFNSTRDLINSTTSNSSPYNFTTPNLIPGIYYINATSQVPYYSSITENFQITGNDRANGSINRTRIANGVNGFSPSNLESGDNFGYSLANIGDLDGDGIQDLVVGAYNDENSQSGEGAIYILFMHVNGSVKNNVKISDGLGGFTPSGLIANDQFGWSVTSLGDVDRDGVQDLAVGAPQDENSQISEGAIYILFMNSDGTVRDDVKLSDGLNGFSPSGLDIVDYFGISIAGLGDLDLDGVADVAVGAHLDENSESTEGAIYILFLNSDGTEKSHVKISDGLGGFNPVALNDSDQFGTTMANIGDLDGDGIVDLAVGAPFDEFQLNSEGALYILFLHTNGSVKSHVKLANGTNGFLTPNQITNCCDYITNLGDLDGDGIQDLGMGRENTDTNLILYMNTNGTVRSTTKMANISGLGVANSMANIGDLNGDGIQDIVVGDTDDVEGEIYVVNLGIDITSPVLLVESPNNRTYANQTVDLITSANEEIHTWWYNLNGNSSNTTFTPNTTITALTGINNITIWVNDSFGNVNASDVIYFTGGSSLSACQSLDEHGATYILLNDVLDVSGDCFIITADNLTLDGNGKWINSSTLGSNEGINGSSANNITIKNFLNITSFSRGVYFENVNFSNITNNSVALNSNQNIFSDTNSYNNSITDNIIDLCTSSTCEGIEIDGDFNNITRNVIRSNAGDGVRVDGEYIRVENNTVTNNGGSAIVVENEFNEVLDNTLLYNQHGLYLLSTFGSVGNSFIGNNVSFNREYGIYITASFSDVSFINNTITSNNNSGIFLSSVFTSANKFVNSYIVNNGNFSIEDRTLNSENNFLIYNNSFGEIEWTDSSTGGFLSNLTMVGDIGFGTNLVIENNNAYWNESAFSPNLINSSANITLYGLGTLTNVQILKNGTACNASECQTISALSGGTIIFNVTSAGNYSITGDSPPSSSSGSSSGGGGGSGSSGGSSFVSPSTTNTKPKTGTLTNNDKLKDAVTKLLKTQQDDALLEDIQKDADKISKSVSVTVSHKSLTGKSTVTETIKNSGPAIKNFIMYDVIPKSFAAHTDNLTIIAPGARIEIVEEDPELAYHWDELGASATINITYEVNKFTSSDIIKNLSTAVFGSLDEPQKDDDESPQLSVCGNDQCESDETSESCPIDCPKSEMFCIPNTVECSDNTLSKCSSDGSLLETLEICEFGCSYNQCNSSNKDMAFVSAIGLVVLAITVSAIVVLRVKVKKGTQKKGRKPKRKNQQAAKKHSKKSKRKQKR